MTEQDWEELYAAAEWSEYMRAVFKKVREAGSQGVVLDHQVFLKAAQILRLSEFPFELVKKPRLLGVERCIIKRK